MCYTIRLSELSGGNSFSSRICAQEQKSLAGNKGPGFGSKSESRDHRIKTSPCWLNSGAGKLKIPTKSAGGVMYSTQRTSIRCSLFGDNDKNLCEGLKNEKKYPSWKGAVCNFTDCTPSAV